MDGTLLFREDFGGNDPNDPVAGTEPAPGMTRSYLQIYDTATCRGSSGCIGMGSGRYLLTKVGYRNSSSFGFSHWFIMDDHTYPNDYSRGYLLEIDGRTDTETLFETVIDGLCEGSKLTFSAYVTNVTTAFSYFDRGNNGDPQLSFVLVDPETGAQLAAPYQTGPIPVDVTYRNTSGEWRNSAHWNLVGMNFTVPQGKTAVKLIIKNACTASNGNDFAIDDIEIRLCAPPVTIEGASEVCQNEAATLTANFTNDGTFAEPLEYKWWYSADSLNWTELSETTNVLSMPVVQKADTGWYKLMVAGAGNIGRPNCRATSEPFRLTVKQCVEPLCMDGTLLFREDFGGNDPSDPEVISDANAARAAVLGMSSGYIPCLSRTSGMSSGKFLVTKQGYQNGIQWHIMDDHTYPNDKTKGYLLQIDGRGDDAPFYTTTIEGLCPGSRLTFSAYVANVMTWGHYTNPNRHDIYPRMKFVLTDPSSGTELATYDTGDIPFDSASIGDNSCWQNSAHWRLIGMNFTVPNGTYRVKLTIYNNVAQNGSGNDFVLDDIEIHLCTPPVTIEGEAEVCMNETATLTANFENDGTFAEPLGYKWFFSADSVSWETLDETSNVLNISNVQKADSGWYKVAVSGIDNIESLNCRAMSEPFLLTVNECVDELCVEGTLLFREDFEGNRPEDPAISMASVQGMDPSYHNSGNGLGSGNYTLRKEGWHNGIQWHWQDDHTYFGDKTRGYLLEVDGVGGAKPFYSKTIEGLCAGTQLTFSAYVVNVHYAGQLDYFGSSYVFPRMKFVLKDPTTGAVLAEKSTGDIQPDWRYGTPETWKYARDNQLSAEWQLIGMNFVVPDGIESIQMYIYNDVARNGSGNDFALDDIEIHLCAPPVTIEGETEICADSSVILTANFTNDGTFHEPLAYKWWFSADSLTWIEKPDFNGEKVIFNVVQPSDSGWYRVAVAGEDNIESINCRAMSEPFLLSVQNCEPPVPPCPELLTITADTTVCDTLMPYRWRDTLFTEPTTYKIIVRNERDCDSLLYILTLNTQVCCPDLLTITADTIVCDTLMPYRWRDTLFTEPTTYKIIVRNERDCDSLLYIFTLDTKACCPDTRIVAVDTTVCDTLLPFTWTINGQTFVFEQVETQEREIPHSRWADCIGTTYTVSLDTFHCEHLYPLIVNKYNWQLLLDHTALRKFFPGRTARAYQWYKNDESVLGAIDDDYAEQNELNGRFQLRIELDNNRIIWSNILEIGEAKAELPVYVHIYDSHGMPVREDQVSHGIYLYRYEQGDKVWTEKKWIP